MDDFIRQLPKTELHLHIEGTLEPEMMFNLADRNKIKLPYPSIEKLREAYQFTNLQSFLDLYLQGMQVLQTERDFYELTWAYLTRVHQQNVRHVEIFFVPQGHTNRNIAFETVFHGVHQALNDARSKLDITSHLILCFLRNLPEEQAFITLQQALPYKDNIIAVGLESSEVGFPPKNFQRVYKQAREAGFLTVAHAGEEGPPDYIWQALDLLQVKRIDHGVRSIEDPRLIERLVKEQIPLTVCPLSNIRLCVFPDLKHHPLKKLMDLGVCATINSDDPAYFGGYVEENYRAIHKAFDFNHQSLAQLAKNGFMASFIDEETKEQYFHEIEGLLKKSTASSP